MQLLLLHSGGWLDDVLLVAALIYLPVVFTISGLKKRRREQERQRRRALKENSRANTNPPSPGDTPLPD